MSDFLMPALGADMEAGTLVEWLIKLGDRVKRGDIVAVVETKKARLRSRHSTKASSPNWSCRWGRKYRSAA